jgi:maltooligosyltrehalose trehalohydrolase
VWAPKRKKVSVVIDGNVIGLQPEDNGYFSGVVGTARPGTLYKFKLDEEDYLYPDPQSRFQPDGPHGPSRVVDPEAFPWTDMQWRGINPRGLVIYELHLGTFTPEGSWKAARAELAELRSIGITLIEVMPIAEFSGRWGWGYDGVDLFAPAHIYGSVEDAKSFIDEAHRLGMGVILDVVYNHFGPDGNYVKAFSDDYFTDEYQNDWGESINFGSEPVRDFYRANAAYWIEEFHFDGLRLDATQDIHDTSQEHILTSLTKHAREAAGERTIFVVAENEPQHSWMAEPVQSGGYGLDALWNDDFQHSAFVCATGRNEAYYTDYFGTAQEFISAAKYGYLYQGQRYKWQKKRRGAPSFALKPWNFVTYLENHDQVANSARGERISTFIDAALYRALSALLMLGPSTPMLFQGQEFGSTSPFLYFCDHHEELGNLVRTGRVGFLQQFRSLSQPEMEGQFPDPCDASTFENSKLDFSERERNARTYSLYKDLIKLRHDDPVFSRPGPRGVDGAVLANRAFVMRYFNETYGDRLLIVNLGRDLHLDPAPEPLLAPPLNRSWKVLWSSEDPRYGGLGTFPPDSDQNWRVAGHSALALAPLLQEENA